MHRRAVLGAAAAGLAGLAGCATASGARGPPQVPREELAAGGWEQIDSTTEGPAFEESVGPATLTGSMVTRVFEDRELRTAVRERTLDQFDAPLSTFFASRIWFDPDITDVPGGIGEAELLDAVESQARAAFTSQLRTSGLEDVSVTGEGSLVVDSGSEAKLTNYEGSVSFEGLSLPLPDGTDLSVPGGQVTVAGHLATWVTDGSVLLVGGAYPAENYAQSVERAPSEAIEVSLEIDLGLQPERYREELFGLMKSVE